VLLIITDDAGFGVPSTFGGVIPTPAMERGRDVVRLGHYRTDALEPIGRYQVGLVDHARYSRGRDFSLTCNVSDEQGGHAW
jgi:hypothetical protein